MKHIAQLFRSLSLIGPAVVFLAACGGSGEGGNAATSFSSPERRASNLSVTPSLDLSGLFRPELADRIQVDEILINLSEVRMLGADPRIPAEGVALLTEDRIIRSTGGGTPAVTLTFPEYLLDDEELAVFVRVGQSDRLDGASVIVRGRYQGAEGFSGLNESQTGVEATDPDVDPMDDPDPGHDCATDPDVDPMDCGEKTSTSKAALQVKRLPPTAVPFELRDEQVVNLVATLGASGAPDVILGIPAARWITPELVTTLESAFDEHDQAQITDPETTGEPGAAETVVASAASQRPLDDNADKEKLRHPGSCSNGYVLDGRDNDALRERR